MKRCLTVFLAFCACLAAVPAHGQLGPGELEKHLDHLRRINAQQRAALFESSNFQKNSAAQRQLDELVFTPLLTGDLQPYRNILVQGLTDQDAFIRKYTASLVTFAAMSPVMALSPQGERAITLRSLVTPLLLLASPPEEEDVRLASLTALTHMSVLKDKSIQAMLEQATQDPDAKVRGTALLGVATSTQNPAFALETELKLIGSDPDPDNRKMAAAILGESPARDSRILSSLRSAIEDASPRVQRTAVHALYRKAQPDNGVTDTLRAKLVQPNLNGGVRSQIEADLRERNSQE